MKLKILLLMLIAIHFMSGCTLIWSDDVFVATLLKKYDAFDIEMIAEPNYLQIGAGILKTRNSSVSVITPAVVVRTGD